MLEILREIDSSDDIESLPVVEGDTVFTSDSEQPATEDAIVGLFSLESFELGEVFVDFNCTILSADSKCMCLRGIYCGPDQISTIAEGRVLKLRV